MAQERNALCKNRTGSWEWCVTGLLLLSLFMIGGLRQTAMAQNSESSGTETGVVTGDQVRLRGGPGTRFKPVGEVNEGTTLQVQEREDQWVKVAPPDTASVWIYGKFVEQTESNKGKVTGTNVNVRPLPRTDRTNVPVGQVSEPLTVTIRDKQDTGDEHPWYRIKMPETFSVWIHSDYVRIDASGGTEEGGTSSEPGNRGASPDQVDAGTGNGLQTAPQKGAGGNTQASQEGANQTGTETEPTREPGGEANVDDWVNRLESIQESVRQQRQEVDKLEWDFSPQIQQLDSFVQNSPVDRLTSRARALRNQLSDLQKEVESQREQLNKKLQEIQKARKQAVQNTIQGVLEAKGFTWNAIGHVESVGNLYFEPPANYELVKAGERLYFLRAGRDILNLANYRGLQVAVSGKKISAEGKAWNVPLLRVQRIEPISK